MIRLHVLGGMRLDGVSASRRRSALLQPRRTALLAYLALRAPHGPQRRDTLLGVFWPESDTNHARGALRNALHFLRVSLGPGVIVSHGSEEIEVDRARLWCDAVEFERLLDRGDLAGALQIYAGDLLDGFFISDAPEFERWLDDERLRLRRRAADAARVLAAEAESRNERGLASLLLRRLLELNPGDEEAACRLMRLLSYGGNRGEALHFFDGFAARLGSEYGLEPGEETQALADAIRAGTFARWVDPHSAVDPAAAPSQPVATGAAPPRAIPAGHTDEAAAAVAPIPTQHTKAGAAALAPLSPGRAVPGADVPVPQPRPGRRKSVLGVAAGAAGIVLLGLAALRASETGTQPAADVVAVLPFQYRGAAEHAYLAEGLADLLAANLSGAGDLRTVDPRALLAGWKPGHPPPEPAVAGRTAAAHGAGLFVLGSITEAAGHLRITAELYGAGARPLPRRAPVIVEGEADDVLALVDRVTLALLKGRDTTTLVEAALRTTYSVEALKAFLRGETALRRADVHAAIEQYRRATEIDSTFALAHYRLSSAAYRQGISRVPMPAAAAALRHAGRLVREDSLLVAAWFNHVTGSVAEARLLYEEALTARPSHLEASFQLGELIFHWGSSIGIPAGEARAHFERVLEAEPHNVQAALHLARLAARDGRSSAVDSLVALMLLAEPDGGWGEEMETLRAFLSSDSAWQDRAFDGAAWRPNLEHHVREAMAAYSYNLAAVERVTQRRLRANRAPGDQARVELVLAQLQVARGRYDDALSTIASGVALPATRRLEYRAMMAALPFLPLGREELEAVRAEIAAQPDVALRDEGGPFAGRGIEYPHVLWPGMFRPRRLYLLAALHIRLGDLGAADAVADSLALEASAEPFAAQYERITRARIAGARNAAAEALRVLGPPQPPVLRTFESLVDYDRPYERWLRAETLRATGRITEALGWYSTFPDPLARDLPYVAPSHLRRAGIYEALGDRAQAAFHYGRFAELWADADPALIPEVERARSRLRELGGR